jgi:integrase
MSAKSCDLILRAITAALKDFIVSFFWLVRPHPYRSMVLLGCTGLRTSEVLGLRWHSVDFERLVMVVKECYARSQVAKLKSEYSQDELPLDPDVATILLEWKPLCPESTGDWVFPSPRTNETLRFMLSAADDAETSGAAGKDPGIDGGANTPVHIGHQEGFVRLADPDSMSSSRTRQPQSR